MDKIKIAAASIRNRFNRPRESIADMQVWSARAAQQGAQLILFPELNLTGHITTPISSRIAEPVPGPSTEKVIRAAQNEGILIAFGIIERDGEQVYCTHVIVDGEGVIGKQRKVHVPAQEQPYWRAGNSIDVFDLGLAKVGITICRDSFFDEMTRTLYFKGAEILLMPFGYYNVPRSRFLQESIHGMSLFKSAWTNGVFCVFCNSAGEREPNEWEPEGRKFPGWAGVIDPWGSLAAYTPQEGNGETMVVVDLDPAVLEDRRAHPNFLARELRPELYQFGPAPAE